MIGGLIHETAAQGGQRIHEWFGQIRNSRRTRDRLDKRRGLSEAVKHQKALEQARFNLDQMEASFRAGDGAYEIHLNNFLASAQSVLLALNKSFGRAQGYVAWTAGRSSRLPTDGKVFKELRNISLKEGPVENAAVFTGWRLPEGDTLPAHATVEMPWTETRTGRPVSRDVTVKNVDGTTKVYKDALEHDFMVVAESQGKTYRLDAVITQARAYLQAIAAEVEEAERLFSRN